MPSPLLETLESRTHLAAAAVAGERYNLVSLLGYDQAGSSWQYRSTYDAGGSNKGAATAKVSVATTKQTFDGHDANPVKFSSSGMTLSTAWYTTSKGSFLSFTSLEAPGFGNVKVNLHDTRVGPKVMYLGETYSDKGNFDGTFSFSYGGHNYKGSISGSDTVTSQLVGHESVTVSAGTFDAIKGTYNVEYNGKLKLKFLGISYSAPFTLTQADTFWAAPTVGVVKSQDTFNAKASASVFGSAKEKATASNELLSHELA